MRPMHRKQTRRGFSLMEMIVATAILAGSGAALFTLIGQGSLFGRRAEEQATTLQLAQSVMDASLAMPGEVEEEGTFDQDPRWAYRIQREAIRSVGEAGGNATNSGSAASGSALERVVVEVFPAAERGSSAGSRSERVTCRLMRWIRTASPAPEPASPDSPTLP